MGSEMCIRDRDHAHYLERQLAPAAQAVLPFIGVDFMKLGGRQLSLF